MSLGPNTDPTTREENHCNHIRYTWGCNSLAISMFQNPWPPRTSWEVPGTSQEVPGTLRVRETHHAFPYAYGNGLDLIAFNISWRATWKVGCLPAQTYFVGRLEADLERLEAELL